MFVSAQKILESPEMVDQIEEPYIIIVADIKLFDLKSNHRVMEAVNLIYWQGWETVNFSFMDATMYVMVKNPRPRRKNDAKG